VVYPAAVVPHLHAIEGGGDAVRSPQLVSAVQSFESRALAEGARIIEGRFEVRRRIGSGATGSVYEAFDRTLDRHVAIKVLEPDRARAADREAHILARIRHRNVVSIHDYGFAPEFRYLVLELLVGRDLRQWLAERPTHEEILARLLEAGRGLAAVHAAGLVHRDFKPSNVILTDGESTSEGRSERAVVIDFGLARNLETLGKFDSSDGEVGTPLRPKRGSSSNALAYLAPEHLVHEAGDARSDQFAWCVVLWEALTGSNPFTGDDPVGRHRSIAQGPGEFGADVPAHVARALRRGLSFRPTDRFASMTELLDAIERPPSRAPRFRRRPLLSALVIAATFALGWGVAPDPVIEHAVSEDFDPADFLLDEAKQSLAAGDTVLAKARFDAATKLALELEHGSASYCRFGDQIEPFADAMLAAGDLRRGRVLYTRAINFAKDCHRSRGYIEQLQGKYRSSREAFLSTQPTP
jgi:hypothetical protein